MMMHDRVRSITRHRWDSIAPSNRRRTAATAAVLLALLAGWFAISGSGSEAAAPLGPTPVNVLKLEKAQGYARAATFLGRVEPAQESRVGFEIGGEIAAVLVDEGQSFGAGAPLARLDTSLLRARRAELVAQLQRARAEQRLASSTFTRLDDLRRANAAAASALELDAARFEADARVAAAQAAAAQIAYIDTQLRKSVLRAPFAGTILERHADDGEVMAPGAPVLTVAATRSPRVRVGVPADLSGTAARLGAQNVTIGTAGYLAQFERVIPSRSRTTQTVDVLYRLPVSIGTVEAGAPARLTLRQDQQAEGFWVPVSALAESEGGLWSLYRVVARDGEQVLAMTDVELLHQDVDRVYVRGPLPDGSVVVRSGLHRLASGMAVAPRFTSSGDAR